MYKDVNGKWEKRGNVKALKEPSKLHLKIRKEKEKKRKKQELQRELDTIDRKILMKLPELIERFLPLLETLGIEITEEEKKILERRKEIKEKL